MQLDVYGDTLCAVTGAAVLASTGNEVTLHPGDGTVRRELEQGACPFREPGLGELLAEQFDSARLVLGTPDQAPGSGCDAVLLALAPDALEQARAIVSRLAAQGGRTWLVINQSTFPVGTSEQLQQQLDGAGVVASLPDLLREGAAVEGFARPGHWLLGCDDEDAELRVRELLRPFNRRRDNILVMSPRAAEFTKLAINGMLATRLGFMNDMASLAERLQVDIEDVRQGIGADPRIGEAYLYPGCGFGGLNFSRDVMSLADTLADRGASTELLEQVLAINERQKEVLFRKFWRHYDTNVAGRRVTLWGAAFKPGAARVDNAPSLRLIDALLAQGVQVQVHDPRALPALRAHYGMVEGLSLHEDPWEALKDADALMLVTEWKTYWSPDFDRMRELMRQPLILDGRNVYDPGFVRRCGLIYYGVGRT